MKILPSLFGRSRPPLQPTGPAPFPQPPERDRQALFWWLKRNTSYTAVAYNAGLWTAFAVTFESWLRSQASPAEEDVTTYKYILDTQINYEQGLRRLAQGDRSVWLPRSSEGWLAKINTGLIARRMELHHQPDEYFEQYGIPAQLIRAYYKAHDAAMAIGWEAWYDGMGFPHGSAAALLASLPVDASLPVPRWEVAFAPGHTAPKDGIYEQVDEAGHVVGGMAYFIKGMESAKESWLEFGPNATQQYTNKYFWRLIWEDTRYKDGKIPEEEALYPMPSESLNAEPAADAPLQLRCEADQPCPREGWWFTPAHAGSRRHFKEGEVMPAFDSDYGVTIWQWDGQQ